MLTQLFFEQSIGFGLLFGEFLLAALLVFFLSMKLTGFADFLERNSGLSDVWIGMLLLAFITSLPEAVSSIGSTFIDGAINLGVSNLAGSNMFNIVIIVILDLVQGPGPILLLIKDHQVFIVAGGILLMALVGCAIALHIPFAGLDAPGRFTGIFFSIIIIVAFLVITWFLSNREKLEPCSASKTLKKNSLVAGSLRKPVLLFSLTSVFVIIASVWLLGTCDALARQPVTIGENSFQLSHTFVGAFFVAIVTSLPELFVSLGALRLGQVNMSIANIFGSNIINMGFIPIMHLFAGHASFYASISPLSVVMLFTSIIMSTLFITGLLIHSKRSFCYLGWEVTLILATYGCATYLLLSIGIL